MSAWCHICGIEVPKENWKIHVISKQHKAKEIQKHIRKRQLNVNQQRGILVSDMNPVIPAEILVQHFKKHRHVVAVLVQESLNRAVVQFSDPQSTQFVLRMNSIHQVNGQFLKLTQRIDPAEDPTDFVKPKKLMDTDWSEIDAAFTARSINLEEQIAEIVSRLTISEDEERKRIGICRSLEQWLSVKYPGCRIKQFGSVVSGLASQDSDLDLYLDLPKGFADRFQKNTNPGFCILDPVSHVLRQHPDIRQLFFVRGARIPVIKFTHSPTGLSCDLTCSNEIAIYNSQLIRYLQFLDPRIRAYFFLIKWWAQSTRAKDGLGLSSYALIMMAVFHLQQVKPPVLPSIKSVQQQVPVQERIFINGWNASVPPIIQDSAGSSSYKEASKNPSTVFQLVHQFFTYFAQLDVSKVVLCPIIGLLLPKKNFSTDGDHLLPACMDSYYKNVGQEEGSCKQFNSTSQLCVQDPFELNFNVAASLQHLERLQERCAATADLCCSMMKNQVTQKVTMLWTSVDLNYSKVEEMSHYFYLTRPATSEELESMGRDISSTVREIFHNSFLMTEKTSEDSSSPAKRLKLSREPPAADWLMNVPFDLWNGRSDVIEQVSTKSTKSFMEVEREATLKLASLCDKADVESLKPYVTCQISVNMHLGKKKKPKKEKEVGEQGNTMGSGRKCTIGLKLVNEESGNRYNFSHFASGLRHRWAAIVNHVVREKQLPFS